METIISAPFAGTISRVEIKVGDSVDEGDLIVCIASPITDNNKWCPFLWHFYFYF